MEIIIVKKSNHALDVSAYVFSRSTTFFAMGMNCKTLYIHTFFKCFVI